MAGSAGHHESEPPCRSCGSARIRRVGPIPPGAAFAGREFTEALDPGVLYRCQTCHLWFRHPVPDEAVLQRLYVAGDPDAWQYPAAQRRDWQLAHQWVQTSVDGTTILDIGCFDGAFLELFSPIWDRYGIEMNPRAAETARARGITMLGDDVARLSDVRMRFDVVVAFDLVEHVPDPRALLGTMAAVTKPGGSVIIGTGNTAAPSWRFMGSRYWYCAIPEHLSFMNPAWCRRAAQHLRLELVRLDRYSHAIKSSVGATAGALAKNLLYRTMPSVFGFLRARGFGTLDVRRYPAWAKVPPEWMSARDHLLAVFRTP